MYLDEQESSLRTKAQDYLLAVSSDLSLRWPGLSVSTCVQSGEPDAGIATAEAETRAAMVIMATHGRTGTRRAAVGSVAGRVLEHGHTLPMLARPAALAPATRNHEASEGSLRNSP
jgi:nucleotide-binding universal stress UspA family protein